MRRAMVPSDIDVEDKIIGPFTLKQFIYLIIGAMAVFILYTIFKDILILFIALALPVVLLTLAFVFYRFNEQPFEQFLAALIAFYAKPARRIWKRDTTLADIGIMPEPERKVGLPEVAKKKPVSRLDELAYILDTRGWESEPQKQSKENK
jgi:hypothetical protein